MTSCFFDKRDVEDAVLDAGDDPPGGALAATEVDTATAVTGTPAEANGESTDAAAEAEEDDSPVGEEWAAIKAHGDKLRFTAEPEFASLGLAAPTLAARGESEYPDSAGEA